MSIMDRCASYSRTDSVMSLTSPNTKAVEGSIAHQTVLILAVNLEHTITSFHLWFVIKCAPHSYNTRSADILAQNYKISSQVFSVLSWARMGGGGRGTDEIDKFFKSLKSKTSGKSYEN